MAAETTRARTAISGLKTVWVGWPNNARPFSNQDSTNPSTTPIIPPPRLSSVASATNWSRMSRRLAPMALRMPISRVRSVTVTSMMFMMPMPPTSREMPAIAPRKTTKVLVVSCSVSMVSCWLDMEKSSSLVIRWRSRKTVDTSRMAASIDSTSRTETLTF